MSTAMSTDVYDDFPYDCRAVPQTSLDRLATAALLKGREAAPPSQCRVLELGCGDATNLLPLALAYPESRFVGVDRSGIQLEMGRAAASEIGVKNLELLQADITDLEEGVGPFDYVIVHGVYSWVSDAARARILGLIGSELSERGIAYLSYNTLPAWGVRGYLRDLLLERTRGVEGPREKIAAARAHLELLGRLRVGGDQDPYAALLGQMIARLILRSDSYLLHEYLAEHNRAFHVGEILDALETHGLTVVDDLIRATANGALQDELEVQLYRADLPRKDVEGAVDLLTFRQLRASLIARGGVPARVPSPQHVFEACEVAAPLRPLDAVPWEDDVEQRFESPGGATISARTPLLRAALTLLGETWPVSFAFPDLLERAQRLVGAHAPEPPTLGPEQLEETFLDLMRLRGLGFVELRAHAPHLVTRPSATPLVSPLTRRDALCGRPVTSQLHFPISLDPGTAAVAGLLDGTRNIAALSAQLEQPTEAVARSVQILATNALLVG